jgi:hypothetical protein
VSVVRRNPKEAGGSLRPDEQEPHRRLAAVG